MSTSFALLALTEITPHPNNVRHDATADVELIESVRTNGLVQPLVVAPTPDGAGFVLVAGHRRLDALQQAGITTAPAVIREDLVTEAQIVEAMLIENGRRQDLTPVEEAEGYEQLELFGYKPKDIARATGRSEKTVRERLKLKGLSDKARGKVHDGQVSITDALALLEFEDDHEAYAQLEQELGGHNFAWKLDSIRRQRKAREQADEQRAEYAAAGIPQIDDSSNNYKDGPYPIQWSGAPNRDDHQDCLAWRTDGANWVQLVCTSPATHRGETDRAGQDDPAQAERLAQIEKDRQAFEARRDAEASARSVRSEHIRSTVRDWPTGKTFVDLIRVVLPSLIEAALNEGHHRAFLEILGFDVDTDFDVVRRELAVRSDNTAGQVLVAFLAAIAESRIEDIYDEHTAADADRYLKWLTDIGHTFCDIDIDLADTAAEYLSPADGEEAAS